MESAMKRQKQQTHQQQHDTATPAATNAANPAATDFATPATADPATPAVNKRGREGDTCTIHFFFSFCP